MERAELTMEDCIQETCLISAVTSGPTEPKPFQEAWHSPVEKEEKLANCNQEGNNQHDQQQCLEENRQSKDTRKQKIDREQVGVQNQKR